MKINILIFINICLLIIGCAFLNALCIVPFIKNHLFILDFLLPVIFGWFLGNLLGDLIIIKTDKNLMLSKIIESISEWFISQENINKLFYEKILELESRAKLHQVERLK